MLKQGGQSITIEGGQVRGEQDFWEQIAYQLNLASLQVKRDGTSTNDNSEGSLGLSVPGINAGAKKTKGSTRTIETSITYSTNVQRAVLESLQAGSISLLVDDFHYIDKDVQKKIIQALKGAVFKGLSVILLAVPHRAFDPMTVEQELEGRFKHVEIPPWELDDLLLIPVRGFAALNVRSSNELNTRICAEGFGNPLLVQEICSELCIKSNISERRQDVQAIDKSVFDEALNEIAKSKGFPKYSKLKAGPDAKKKKMLRNFKDERKQDKYSAILTALATIGPLPRTNYEDLRVAMQGLLTAASMPAKHEVTAALTNMSKIARKKIDGEPPLEWVDSDDALVITDPFLLFYMKWAADAQPADQRTLL